MMARDVDENSSSERLRSYCTCLKSKLQVVLSDDEDGHCFDKEEEPKCNAEGSLASFLQLKVVGREGEKDLTEGIRS